MIDLCVLYLIRFAKLKPSFTTNVSSERQERYSIGYVQSIVGLCMYGMYIGQYIDLGMFRRVGLYLYWSKEKERKARDGCIVWTVSSMLFVQEVRES